MEGSGVCGELMELGVYKAEQESEDEE